MKFVPAMLRQAQTSTVPKRNLASLVGSLGAFVLVITISQFRGGTREAPNPRGKLIEGKGLGQIWPSSEASIQLQPQESPWQASWVTLLIISPVRKAITQRILVHVHCLVSGPGRKFRSSLNEYLQCVGNLRSIYP
jgi:hypothetical protein